MKAYVATFGASSISGIVLMACIVAMWSIHANVQSIYQELESEMFEFKVIF
jgi:hypothetical protein